MWIHNSNNSCTDLQSHNFIPTSNKYYNNFDRVFMPKIFMRNEGGNAILLYKKLINLHPKSNRQWVRAKLWRNPLISWTQSNDLNQTPAWGRREWGGGLHLGKVPPINLLEISPPNTAAPSVHVNQRETLHELWKRYGFDRKPMVGGKTSHEVAIN